MENHKKLKNFIKTTIREFLNENKNLSLRDDVVSIIRDFCNKYGKPLVAHPHIKRIENDTLGILAEKIDKFLNYGNYRKIWSIINKFTNNDALFDDNNVILAETILDEISKKKEKYFSVIDKSGRSMKPYKLDKTHIEKTWDLSEEDWDTEKTLGDFLEDCYIGDTWNTNSVKFECIAIK